MFVRQNGAKRLRKVAVAMMLILALIPATVFAATAPSDIGSHWAKDQINSMVNGGLINGYPDGTFRPDASITRAEFMQIVNGAFKYTEKATVSFTDVPADAWYADAVAKAVKAGYITGYADGTMLANAPISRQEAATIIMKAKKLSGTVENMAKFNDYAAIPEWSKNAIGAVVKSGIMGGYPDGSFMAGNNISRAEAVTALNKAMGTYAGTVFDKAGTFGSATEGTVIQGDVVIKAPGVTLQNITITGNLTIAKEVGNGDVTLKSVTIKGNTFVNGGGVNSIYFVNVTTGKVYVLKDDGPVRIVASGTSAIEQLMAGSTVKLEEVDMTGAGFEGITVEKNAAGGIAITLVGVKCDTIDIKAEGVTLNADKASTIATLTVDAIGTKITGTGTITNAVVNAGGVNFETAPVTTVTAPNVTAPTITPPSAGGGGGGSLGTISTTGIVIYDANDDVVWDGTLPTNDVSVDLSDTEFTTIKKISIEGTSGTALVLSSVYGPDTGTLAFSKTFSDMSNIQLSQILNSNSAVYIDTLKAVFGEELTLTGQLTKSGYTSRSVTLTLQLGSYSGETWSNENVTGIVTEGDILVTIINDANLEGLGIEDTIISLAGAIPAAVTVDGTEVVLSTIPTNGQKTDLKNAIVAATGLDAWSDVMLSDLVGVEISIEDTEGNIFLVGVVVED